MPGEIKFPLDIKLNVSKVDSMGVQEARKLFLGLTLVASVMYFTDGFSIMGIYFGELFSVENFLQVYSRQLYLLLLLSLLLGLTMGRVFCGWVCPITAVMSFTSFGKSIRLPLQTKYLFLIATALAIYSSYRGWISPSSEAIRLTFGGIVGFAVASSLFTSRFFCTNLCPVGAYFSLLGILRAFRLKVGEECKGCRKCNHVCEMSIDVMNSKPMYECSLCWNCVDTCPYKAIKLKFISQLM